MSAAAADTYQLIALTSSTAFAASVQGGP